MCVEDVDGTVVDDSERRAGSEPGHAGRGVLGHRRVGTTSIQRGGWRWRRGSSPCGLGGLPTVAAGANELDGKTSRPARRKGSEKKEGGTATVLGCVSEKGR